MATGTGEQQYFFMLRPLWARSMAASTLATKRLSASWPSSGSSFSKASRASSKRYSFISFSAFSVPSCARQTALGTIAADSRDRISICMELLDIFNLFNLFTLAKLRIKSRKLSFLEKNSNFAVYFALVGTTVSCTWVLTHNNK